MNIIEQSKKDEEEKIKNIRKLILIENIDELNLNGKKKREFIKFFYENLDMNLLQVYDKFKNGKE